MNRGVRKVTIIGGGLAGLALGIRLRQRSVPVELHEAGRHPRHRVCGEFLSGRGLQVLDQLRVHERLVAAGAVSARTVAFFDDTRLIRNGELPQPGLCLSRRRLDALLAEEFRTMGGVLTEGARWNGDWNATGTVRATGRRPTAIEGGWRWLGLKVHATNLRLSADLEMHFARDGYVGLCAIEDQRVNICGLFRSRETIPALQDTWQERLRGAAGSMLRRTLAGARFDDTSFCAVAGLSLRRRKASEHGECCVGDAIGLTPPVTGNGMSMALESAALATGPLTAWNGGELDWPTARHDVAAACDAAFALRLRWAAVLQRLLLTPGLRAVLVPVATCAPALWQVFYHRTR